MTTTRELWFRKRTVKDKDENTGRKLIMKGFLHSGKDFIFHPKGTGK